MITGAAAQCGGSAARVRRYGGTPGDVDLSGECGANVVERLTTHHLSDRVAAPKKPPHR